MIPSWLLTLRIMSRLRGQFRVEGLRDADAVISERPRGVQPWQGSEGRRGWREKEEKERRGEGERIKGTQLESTKKGWKMGRSQKVCECVHVQYEVVEEVQVGMESSLIRERWAGHVLSALDILHCIHTLFMSSVLYVLYYIIIIHLYYI